MMDRSTAFIWGILIIGLVWSLGAQQKITFYESSKFGGWVHIDHESETDYFLKTDSIIGFAEPAPGDPRNRSGILLQNGATLLTSLDLESFQKLVKEATAESEVVGVKD